jgi:hypothetical protein
MEDELVKQQPAFESDCDEKSTYDSKMKELVDKLSAKNEPEIHCVSMEMPRYKCIKEVWALKIKSIVFDTDLASETGRETDGSATFTPEDERYAPIKLSAEFVHKHKPVEGGYYVVYKDGYKSFSPVSAFEEGYILEQNVPLHISNPFEWMKQWVDSYHRENGGINGSDFLEWVYSQSMTCG